MPCEKLALHLTGALRTQDWLCTMGCIWWISLRQVHCSLLRGKAVGLTTGDTDTGTSQLIAEGKVKLKNDALFECLIETGIKFDDGNELAGESCPPPFHCDG